MNKMQKAAQNLSSILAMLALVCVSLVSFTACNDNEPVAEVTYSWEFEEVSPSTPDFIDDKNKIESTFKAALGASGTATSVTKQGTSETCDQEVLEVCQRAFDSLKDEVWQGRYVFVVTNTTTGTTICKASFSADNDNAWHPFIKSYKASDLKFGDYYYSDGTWSDGGLRTIIGTNKIWTEQIPKPENGKTVIGIVFYVGHHDVDFSDYSATGIGQVKCHGYVVALTNVHNRYRNLDEEFHELLEWGYGPNGRINYTIGTNSTSWSWNGYDDLRIIHEYVNKKKGWEMKHFPAFLACETYGNRMFDKDGNPTNAYDWQHPLAAPNNSSGWFLPSCGQLQYLYQNRSLLSARMDFIRDNTPDGRSYKEHIKWFGKDNGYWSSSEYWGEYSYGESRIMYFDNDGYCSRRNNDDVLNVRAILAF